MTCDDYQEALHALVDDTLTAEARRSLDLHVRDCPRCQRLLRDLREMTRTAAALERKAPPPRVWDRIARAIETDVEDADGSTRWRRPRLWLAAAALVVAVVGAEAVRRLVWTPRQAVSGNADVAPRGAGNASADALVQSVEAELQAAEQHYDKAIQGLEQIVASDQAAMDPAVAESLKKSLATLDGAIAESRAALRAQPEDPVARASLFQGLRRKVGLLQDIVALVNEMRKGDQAGAARVAGRISGT